MAGHDSLSMPVDVGQADQWPCAWRRWAGRACRLPGRAAACPASGSVDVGVAVEAVLAGVVAGLDLDEADVEPRVLVAGEAQRAGDVDGADRLVGLDVVDDDVSGADLHAGPGAGTAPPSQVSAADQGPLCAERTKGGSSVAGAARTKTSIAAEAAKTRTGMRVCDMTRSLAVRSFAVGGREHATGAGRIRVYPRTIHSATGAVG